MKYIIINISICIVLLLVACKSGDDMVLDIHYPQDTAVMVDSFSIPAGRSAQMRLCNIGLSLDKIDGLKVVGFSENRVIDFSKRDSCIIIDLIGEKLKESGVYTIDATVGELAYTIALFEVKPGKAVGKIESFIGPKTVNYGDYSGSMVTAFPVDSFHNATGAEASTNFGISTGYDTELRIIKNNGTYSSIIIHQEKSPKVLVGAQVNNANTIEQSMRYLSGCPQSLVMNVSEVFPVADGRQFFNVSTDVMYDPKGRVVANGTMVLFSMNDEKENVVSSFRAITVNGIASTWVKNPIYGGNYILKASSCDAYLAQKPLYFKDLISDFKYEWDVENNQITIGPIISNLGQFLPNGTLVTISFAAFVDQNLQGVLTDGKAIIDLDNLWSDQRPRSGEAIIYDLSFPIKSTP